MKMWQVCWHPPDNTDPRWIFINATRPHLAARKAALQVMPRERTIAQVWVRECVEFDTPNLHSIRKYYVSLSRVIDSVEPIKQSS